MYVHFILKSHQFTDLNNQYEANQGTVFTEGEREEKEREGGFNFKQEKWNPDLKQFLDLV